MTSERNTENDARPKRLMVANASRVHAAAPGHDRPGRGVSGHQRAAAQARDLAQRARHALPPPGEAV